MSDRSHLLTIGELSRRTGLPVRTIRFYSDEGIVPEAERSEAGYRLYDAGGLARLELVRTLRDLGIDLAAIRRLLDREVTLAEVLTTHAAALEAQIRALRLQRGVLRAIAERAADPEEIETMHELARVSAEGRRRIAAEFLDDVFAGVADPAGVAARMRAVQPDLPEDPSPEQVEAWIELAQLMGDPSFRAAVRAMAERAAAEGPPPGPSPDQAKAVTEHGLRAIAEGVDPASAEAEPYVAAMREMLGDDGPPAELAERIEAFADRRVERYWRLLATVNGRPPTPETVPAWEWFAAALRARA